MKPPAQIKGWLTSEELMYWVREAKSVDSHTKRLVIWLTYLGFHANQVSDYLQISKQAVWLWVGQYNKLGPEGLSRRGRGGRRWFFISLSEEKAFLDSLLEGSARGEILTAKQILPELEKLLGRQISLSYVYKLLHRHNWRKLGPRPHHVKSDKKIQDDFKKNSP